VDQYSGFPHIFECGKTATARQVVDHAMALVTNYSIPLTIYTDGGPQFFEDGVFDEFCKKCGIEHVRSSPHHPQSNRVAEETVKEMKKIIRATFIFQMGKLDAESASAGLLMFRNTPRSPFNLCPAEMLFGQKIWDSLPISRNSFKPVEWFEVEKRRQEVFTKQRLREGKKSAREFPLLAPGQRVFVQNPGSKRWTDSGCVLSF
jgi:hypothetical protein